MDEKEFETNNENEKSIDNTEKLENNDGWKFDAEAPTLNENIIQNGEFEIQIPASSKYETAPRPQKTPVVVAEEKKSAGPKKHDSILFALLAVVVVLFLGASITLGAFYYTAPNSDEKMNPGNVAMTVGETPVSVGMYNYYYTCITQNYLTYAGYGYYDIDTTKSYDTQMTTDEDGNEISWAQKFENDTVDQIQYITAYYEEAVANGVELTQAQKDNITTSLEGLKKTASDNDKSVNDYISEIYGDYCGYATLEKMLEQCYIAENYYQQKQIEYTVTTEQEQAYFEEHKTQYENVSFAYLQVPYEEGGADAALENAKSYLSDIKSVDDMKKLIPTVCKELIDDYVAQGYASTTDECAEMLAANIEASISAGESGFIQEAIDWLFADDTAVGSCNAFDDADNSLVYILLKTSEPVADDSQVYSVRHILVTPKTDDEDSQDAQAANGETEYTDEQWAAAEKEANEILDEYNETDKTEKDFALLAEKYSDDTESTSNGSSGLYGGLYEGVSLGQMVPSFEEWALDSSRQFGDVGIVKSDYGYHIMFFVENTSKYLYDCKTALRKEMEGEFVDSAEIKIHKSAMKKVKVAKPTSTDGAAATE